MVRVGSESSGRGRVQNQGLEALRSQVRGHDDLEQWGEMGLMYEALHPPCCIQGRWVRAGAKRGWLRDVSVMVPLTRWWSRGWCQ